jgi:hypothetical protein
VYITLTPYEFALLASAFLGPVLIGLFVSLLLNRAGKKQKTLVMVIRVYSGLNLVVGNMLFLFETSVLARALTLSMVLTGLIMIALMYPFSVRSRRNER